MKRFWVGFLAACLIACMGLTAAAQTTPGGQKQGAVLAEFAEDFDENTYLAWQKDGVFTVVTRDGATLTAEVKTGGLPQGARLMVIAVPEGGEAHAWFSSVLAGQETSCRPYALSFVQDGEPVPFAGELTVCLTVPDGAAAPQIYGVSTQGQTYELTAARRDDRLCFETRREVPYYVLAEKQADAGNPPSTGEAIPFGWLAAATASGLMAVVFGICRRRFDKRVE